MKNKTAWCVVAGIVMVIIVFAVVGSLYEKSTYYDIRADWERIKNSEYSYLMDASVLTAEDFPAWCRDFLTIPQRQYFTFDDTDLGNDEGFHDRVFICDDSDISVKSTTLFDGKMLIRVNDETLRSLDVYSTERVSFENVIGAIMICFAGEKTYVIANGACNDSSCFVINESLKEEWNSLWTEMEPQCKKDRKEKFYFDLIYWNE